MSRILAEKMCCVCLGTTSNLNRLTVEDGNNITLLSKLQMCVSEIEWLASYHICEQCMKLLDISYTFRETCCKSELIRVDKNNQILNDNPYKSDLTEEAELEDIKEEYDEIRYKLLYSLDKMELGTDNIQTTESIKEEYAEIKDVVEDQVPYKLDSTEAELRRDQSTIYEPNLVSIPTNHEFKLENTEDKPKNKKQLQFPCDNTYKTSTKLDHCVKEHGMNKIDVQPLIGDNNASRLQQHIQYHQGNVTNLHTYVNKHKYRCEDCGKCFNTHKYIRSHKLMMHTDSNSWKYCCEICNKAFPIKLNYDRHMRRHTGDEKFECHLCQRKFTHKCFLQRHMKTHSDVREYKCAHCEREYKDPRVLKIHMAKMHGIGVDEIKIPHKEKKYPCHMCTKSYYDKNKLTRHLYTHSGEKPYDCPVCGKKFNDNSYVKQHLRKAHNMEKIP